LGAMCTYGEIERGTHACRASKLGPVERWWTQDVKLGFTIQDPPPESGRRTHLLYFTHSYCILSHVWKLATSLLVLRYYEDLLLFSMSILHVISSRFCLYLLNIYQQHQSKQYPSSLLLWLFFACCGLRLLKISFPLTSNGRCTLSFFLDLQQTTQSFDLPIFFDHCSCSDSNKLSHTTTVGLSSSPQNIRSSLSTAIPLPCLQASWLC